MTVQVFELRWMHLCFRYKYLHVCLNFIRVCVCLSVCVCVCVSVCARSHAPDTDWPVSGGPLIGAKRSGSKRVKIVGGRTNTEL